MVSTMMEVERRIPAWTISFTTANQGRCTFNVETADGAHELDVSVCILVSASPATGCLQAMPETIAHGWKSAESYIVHNGVKHYVFTRYACHRNAVMVGSSSTIVDIQCQSNGWQYKSLPA